MPDSLSCWPVKILDPPFVTVTFVAVNVMAQPLSRICPTYSSEFWANPGRICACLDACGKEGIFNVAVCVEAMLTLLGRRTLKGFLQVLCLYIWHRPTRNVQCILSPKEQ
jgi:hypothetical protein